MMIMISSGSARNLAFPSSILDERGVRYWWSNI